jgi:hypothetical protein
LAEHLAEQLKGMDGITIYSFHALCRRQIALAGMAFPQSPDPAWWDDEAPMMLVEAASKNGLSFDALVIDEGQDFSPAMFLSLLTLLESPDQAPCYLFVDLHQSIYRPDWEVPFKAFEYDLTLNCRNTLPISEAVARVFGDQPTSLGTGGTEPEFLEAQSIQEVDRAVAGALHRLVIEGSLRPDQVVVLTQRRSAMDHLRGRRLGSQSLVAPGESGVVVETIHRFKGLEADIAVVVLDDIESDQDRALAYIGISRARAHVVVVGPAATLAVLRAT